MLGRSYIVYICLLAAIIGLVLPLTTLAETTTRVSVDSLGGEANDGSYDFSVSTDGRFVTFSSQATNLVPGDTNGQMDIFVHDRQTGETTRVSIDSLGDEVNSSSSTPSISADGRFVAFTSRATNLVPGDTNGQMDVFVHDRQSGVTTRVSVDSFGGEATWYSEDPSISADGRFVAFTSRATNLVPGDTNATYDVYVRDRLTGATTRVSVSSSGVIGNNSSHFPSISADGRFIVFSSRATNLVQGDTNEKIDIFVHDRQTGATTQLLGGEWDGGGACPSISADGRFVVFTGATNGYSDIFVHERQTGETTRVSGDSIRSAYLNKSTTPSISTDGRFVTYGNSVEQLSYDFSSDTFVVGGYKEIFIHDRQSGVTTQVNVDILDAKARNCSRGPLISDDGRFVTFPSLTTNLVPGDTNEHEDIFVHGPL